MNLFQIWLKRHDACQPALNWLGDRAPETAWRECPRADWMLWAAGKLKADRRLLVTIAYHIARKVLHLVPAGEDRPRIAIETTERWVRGEATIEEVRAARQDAWDAYAYAATAAAEAAAYAAYAAAAYAAYAAADAYAYAAAAYAAYADPASHADIVREVLPWEMVKTLYDKGA